MLQMIFIFLKRTVALVSLCRMVSSKSLLGAFLPIHLSTRVFLRDVRVSAVDWLGDGAWRVGGDISHGMPLAFRDITRWGRWG
jgi:hypothetical protein